MSLSLGYPFWLLLTGLVVAAGLSGWAYWRTVPPLSRGWRALLGVLRFLVLALAVLLISEPVLKRLDKSTEDPVLAVLIDDTQSLRVTAAPKDTSSSSSIRKSLQPVLGPLMDGQLPGTTRIFAFDRNLRPLQASPLDSLKFRGTRTDIGSALDQLRSRITGTNVGGVLLVSDGQHTTGRSPLRIADRYPVPIHTVTVGDTARRRDLSVQRVTTNDVAYTDTEVPVRATLQAEGVGPGTVPVTLSSGDSVLARTSTELPEGTAEVTVELSFRPRSPGRTKLTMRAGTIAGEATTRNNSRTTSLRVLDRKRRVLLLGAGPSPSFAAVRRALSQDKNTRLTARVPRRDGSFYGGPFPDSLSQYDVLFCAGFPSSAVPSSAVQAVQTALEGGTPAVFALDRQTDLSEWTEAFGPFLPAQPPSLSLQVAPARAAPTPAGQAHSILQVDGTDPDVLSRLPPLQVPASSWKPSPDAEVLATASRQSATADSPLLVVRRRAGQRTALLLGTGLWQWATLPSSLRSADPLWTGLVSNLVQWTATDAPETPVRVRPTTSRFAGGTPVSFVGRVYDESQTPVSSASVEVTVTDSSGRSFSYAMEPSGNGQYELKADPLPAGRYEYEAVARQSGVPLGRDRGDFSVGDLRVEYQSSRADPVLMRQIADRSGGRAYTSSSFSSIAKDLEASDRFSSRTVTNALETELWHRWSFLVVMLGLLASEWVLRRWLGLT